MKMTLEQLDASELWNLVKDRDGAIVNQFATALIGIGALFFAYGSVFKPTTRLLIAFIGFAASLILWLHLYALRNDRGNLRKEIESTNPTFFLRLNRAQSWRSKGWNKILYWPVSRIAIYFMGLVTWSWATIILAHFAVPVWTIVYASISFVVAGIALAIARQMQDLRNRTYKAARQVVSPEVTHDS